MERNDGRKYTPRVKEKDFGDRLADTRDIVK